MLKQGAKEGAAGEFSGEDVVSLVTSILPAGTAVLPQAAEAFARLSAAFSELQAAAKAEAAKALADGSGAPGQTAVRPPGGLPPSADENMEWGDGDLDDAIGGLTELDKALAEELEPTAKRERIKAFLGAQLAKRQRRG